MDKLTEEYITKLEILVKAQESQLENYKKVVELQGQVIKDYEERMNKIAAMIPVLIG